MPLWHCYLLLGKTLAYRPATQIDQVVYSATASPCHAVFFRVVSYPRYCIVVHKGK